MFLGHFKIKDNPTLGMGREANVILVSHVVHGLAEQERNSVLITKEVKWRVCKTVLLIINCTLSWLAVSMSKLCSHCRNQRVGCFGAITSVTIFRCPLDQPGPTNNRLHNPGLRQILPAHCCLLFLVHGESRPLAQSATGQHGSF